MEKKFYIRSLYVVMVSVLAFGTIVCLNPTRPKNQKAINIMNKKKRSRSAFHVGKKGTFFYQDGVLIEEDTESSSVLRFLYSNKLGRFLRFFLSNKSAAKLSEKWQGSALSKRKIKKFIERYNITMKDYVVPAGGYRSFNDFFTRRLKRGARVVDENPKNLISPCDGKCIVIENIDHNEEFFVKGKPFTLSKFLRNDVLATKYSNGTLLLFRLAPYDYHRYHLPTDACVRKHSTIDGKLESVNPLVYTQGVLPLLENKRDILELSSKEFGNILCVSVGATMVGKIVHTFREGEYMKKGEELGYFSFGGSSIVMLFEKDVLSIRKDILNHTQKGYETAVKMGEMIGAS